MSDEKKEQTKTAKPTAPKVKFDTKNLTSSYANVCTMNSTREEVVLNFGLNESWERSSSEVTIELHNRVILSPFAAQRMHEMLTKLLEEYHGRYGAISQVDKNNSQ